MSNNKQSSIDLFIDQLEEKGNAYEETIGVRTVNICIDVSDYMELKQQAKAMHQEEIDQSYRDGFEFSLINECAKKSTSEASAYSDGYSEGYKTALQLVKWKIDNELRTNTQ